MTTNKGYQGALQFGDGEPGELMIVNVKVAGKQLTFQIPEPEGASEFTGVVANGVLQGQIKFKSGQTLRLSMRKGKSYWD